MFGPYAYGTMPNRTHLSERERAIWAAFMRAYPEWCKTIWYDVECGGMRGGTEDLKPEWKDNAKYLGRYKIDVVGEDDESMYVFEVKGEATTKALGELWLYDDLLKEDWNIKKPIQCVCITDEEMPDIRRTMEREGYQLVVVAVGGDLKAEALRKADTVGGTGEKPPEKQPPKHE